MKRVVEGYPWAFKMNALSLRLPYASRWCILALVGSLALTGVYAGLGLYADGAYFLLSILRSHQWFDFYLTRRCVQWITQYPLILGLKLGVRDLNGLIYLHSAGLILLPVACWFFAIAKHVKTEFFWAFVTAFGVGYLSTGLFAIGEYNLTYAMAILSLSILLQPHALRFMDRLLLIILAAALTCSYECMIFMGPVLAITCFFRMIFKQTGWSKVTGIIVCSLLIISAAVACFSILYPHDPGGLFGAIGNIFLFIASTQFIYMLIMLFLFVKAAVEERQSSVLLAGVLSFAHMINYHFWNAPSMNYDFRALAALLITLLMVAMSLYYFVMTRQISFSYLPRVHSFFMTLHSRKLPPFAPLFFFSMWVPFIIQSFDFCLWASRYEHFVLTHSGFIAIDKTTVANHRYNWGWNNPSLSLVFRGGRPGCMITNATDYHRWEPFDPYTMQQDALKDYSKKKTFHDVANLDNVLWKLYR